MRILVAITAALVRDGLTEIRALVALQAVEFGVLAFQRKFRSLVIEPRFRTHGFPACGDVTTLTASAESRVLERAAVRIHVTALTTGKAQPLVMGRWISGRGGVTFTALHVLMTSGERKSGTAVIESGRGLPGVLRMAIHTLRPELSGVGVRMAGRALGP